MILFSLFLAGCAEDQRALGEFDLTVQREGGALSIAWRGRPLLDLTEWSLGQGQADITFNVGSYRFDEGPTAWTRVAEARLEGGPEGAVAVLRDEGGELMGTLELHALGDGLLGLTLRGAFGDRSRARFACQGGESFLGGGGHAFDVDHAGEAFPLWVSEPGIGKVDDEDPPDDWFLTGTRHASSFPVPFFLRPQDPVGLSVVTAARVEVDLCSEGVLELSAWSPTLNLLITADETPLRVVERHTLATGAPALPPDWAFAPWNDAVRGVDRVREVARTLREAGAPSSVIWTEDFKGAEESGLGYHLLGEWEVDETLYPEARALAAELEEQGFKWFAYFSPFIEVEASVWDEARDLTIRAPGGEEPYTFLNPTFREVSVLDLSREDARAWAQDKMQAALDLGFDGWMADYAEWLPPDAELEAMDPLAQHNAYPQLWQATNAEVLEGTDALAFSRSGWLGSQALAPVTWGGDQQTSFDVDDGLPTVVPMGIGLGISGVAFFGHDIAGYSSVGVDPSDKELWMRWCSLGAFTPIMRTHHGAYDTANWQFDSDAETLAHFARAAQEHARLFPYLRGLAELARDTGRPLLLHPALVVEGWPWDAVDAWMLGDALLVAPVLERGATGREVALPDSVGWTGWFDGEPAEAGWFEAGLTEIPVFAREGSVVPTLARAPDTFTEAGAEGVTTLADVDGERVVYVFGAGGRFTEADGTTYTVTGAAARGEAEGRLSVGALQVGTLTVSIDGPVERSYRVVAR